MVWISVTENSLNVVAQSGLMSEEKQPKLKHSLKITWTLLPKGERAA
jgi:hypothetical protein